jgi:hypothetical protein
VRSVAADVAWPIYEIIPATRNPDDFGGYPVPTNGCVRLKPIGDWVDFVERVEAAGGNGILFIDEVAQCTVAVQNALLRVVLDRVVGEYRLPPGVRVVCAANAADQSGGWDLTAAFANRVAHIDWPTPTVDEWTTWLMSFVMKAPEGTATRRPDVHLHRAAQYVAGFLAARPAMLLQLPTNDAQRGRAWPSPRSWYACVRGLAHALAQGGEVESTRALGEAVAAATVGTAAAAAFQEALAGVLLADPEQILAAPDDWAPRVRELIERQRVDLVWVALIAVASAVLTTKLVKGRMLKTRWAAAWDVHRVAREGGASGAALAALGRPLAQSAMAARRGEPAGVAWGLPVPQEEREALLLRAEALR